MRVKAPRLPSRGLKPLRGKLLKGVPVSADDNAAGSAENQMNSNSSDTGVRSEQVTGKVLIRQDGIFEPVKGIAVHICDRVGNKLGDTITDGAGRFGFRRESFWPEGMVIHVQQEGRGFKLARKGSSLFGSDIGRVVDRDDLTITFDGGGNGIMTPETTAFVNALFDFREKMVGSSGVLTTGGASGTVIRAITRTLDAANRIYFPSDVEVPTVRLESSGGLFSIYLPRKSHMNFDFRRILSRMSLMSVTPSVSGYLNEAPWLNVSDLGRKCPDPAHYISEIGDYIAIVAGWQPDLSDISALVGLSGSGLEKARTELLKRVEFYSLYARRMERASSPGNQLCINRLRSILATGKVPEASIFEKQLEKIDEEFERVKRGSAIIGDYVARLQGESERFSALVLKKGFLRDDAARVSGVCLKILTDFHAIVRTNGFPSWVLDSMESGPSRDLGIFLQKIISRKPYGDLARLLPKYGAFPSVQIPFLDTFRDVDPTMNTDFEIDRMIDVKLDIAEDGTIGQLVNLKRDLSRYAAFAAADDSGWTGDRKGFNLERFIHLTENGADKFSIDMAPPLLSDDDSAATEAPGEYSDADLVPYNYGSSDPADVRYMLNVFGQKMDEIGKQLESNFRLLKTSRVSFAAYQRKNRRLLKNLSRVLKTGEGRIGGQVARWYHATLKGLGGRLPFDRQRVVDLNKGLVDLIKKTEVLEQRYRTLTDLSFRRTMDLSRGLSEIHRDLGEKVGKFLVTEDTLMDSFAKLGKSFESAYGTKEVNESSKIAISRLDDMMKLLDGIETGGRVDQAILSQVRGLAAETRALAAPLEELSTNLRFFHDRYQREGVAVKVAASEATRKLESARMMHGAILEGDEDRLSYDLNGILVIYDEERIFSRNKALSERINGINRYEVARVETQAKTFVSRCEDVAANMANFLHQQSLDQLRRRSYLVDIRVCGKSMDFSTRRVTLTPEDIIRNRGLVTISGRVGREDANVIRVLVTLDNGSTWEEARGTRVWIHDFYPARESVYRVAFRLVGADSRVIEAEMPTFDVFVSEIR
ncbi:MAG: hypothetical protein CVV64_19820 [Candidatus Wallbacteria bacterium HGW-Wallbacteria-1]|jgi:hypothetical protein|uniref:Uncharacterized protein n=1 Tax=Candidatus Wallbacteria bacterium HGW-Wallbacteria-1 TaxID=2013854 RepID=A0A2N1PIR6_9BACT|nr:MAG: hypothetical protein CVV64_19820 [Candidatus Wallbacteria bacterium HGW-Wallbacteria-1]